MNLSNIIKTQEALTIRTSDIHILNVSEEDFPEKFRPIIRRLKGAASDSKVKKQMKVYLR